MANNDQNDKEINDYLNGNSDVSKAYRASNKTEPSSHLDHAILSAAKAAVNTSTKTQKTKPKFHKAPWVKPVSIAAMVTLSVSLVVTMQQEAGQKIINEPEVEMYDSTAVVEELSQSGTTQSSDDATVVNEAELKQKKDARVNADAPAALGAATELNRAEEKAEASKSRMKQMPAKKLLLKEKEQVQTDRLEESVFADEQVIDSAPTGVEFDSVIDMEKARELSLQKDALLEIKSLWEEGKRDEAKEKFKLFRDSYPEFSEKEIKEIIEEELFKAINNN